MMELIQGAVRLSGYLLMGLGSFFCLASMVGMVRFPDVYSRLHAGTKALTGGAVFILLGAAVYYLGSGSPAIVFRILLIALFLLATDPIATHAIARACYRHGFKPSHAEFDHYAEDMKARAVSVVRAGQPLETQRGGEEATQVGEGGVSHE